MEMQPERAQLVLGAGSARSVRLLCGRRGEA